MKKIIISIAAVLSMLTATSCSDLLESDNTRQLFNPELNSKTDSLFYALGIMQAMQQVADQYVFQGEMRGDNVATTEYTDNNLRRLADFSADQTNKYDSAYQYYRVINNCNYYLAHRNTSLMTGSTNVTLQEYAAVKSFRAWAYLQLARNYGKVPFFTEPLTSISQIQNSNYPMLSLKEIVNELTEDLKPYKSFSVPTYNGNNYNIGSTNLGVTKTINLENCSIPVSVMLGELYLEVGDYENAAQMYTYYLVNIANTGNNMQAENEFLRGRYQSDFQLPSDYESAMTGKEKWKTSFSSKTTDLISYIPMAVNRLRGTTTGIPETFGYNYYATNSSERYLDKIQLVPSHAYLLQNDSTDYYYYVIATGSTLPKSKVGTMAVGDQRKNATLTERASGDSSLYYVNKYDNGNIFLFRNSTVWLHLAEAFNRMGHPDAAFAILKDGIQDQLLDSTTYLTEDSRKMLTVTYPFLGEEFKSVFTSDEYAGIHSHGAGVVGDGAFPGRSPYQYNTVVGKKLQEIAQQFNVTVGATKQDSINAIEDILCDEYQLEFAFEGTRWYDLMRLARHKNADTTYGANFGGRWLARKLEYKHPVKNLADEQNWYLPFK